MRPNDKKTKELLIPFKRQPSELEPIQMNNTEIEHLPSSKLLCLNIRDDLGWSNRVDFIVKRSHQTKLREALKARRLGLRFI